jgi:organic radical activating enzyme
VRVPAGNVSELFVSFQGEGPHVGRRQLFVRFGGCPLRCRWCDTPDSLVPVERCRVLGPDGVKTLDNPLSPEGLEADVRALIAAAPRLHALAVTGGEPLSQASFLDAWLGRREDGLPVLLETAGVLPAQLARVLPHVTIVSLDVKCPSNTGERSLLDEHRACLELAVGGGREVYVKMPVDEGTDPADVEAGARLVAGVDARVPLFLTPLTSPEAARPEATRPDGSRLTIEPATLGRLQALASRYHPDVRVLPQMHKVLRVP